MEKRLRKQQSRRQEASRVLDLELDVLSPTGQLVMSMHSISTQTDLLLPQFKAVAGPSNISDCQAAGLQEHTPNAGTENAAASNRVSTTPVAVDASPNDNRSSQPKEPPRLRTSNTSTHGISS